MRAQLLKQAVFVKSLSSGYYCNAMKSMTPVHHMIASSCQTSDQVDEYSFYSQPSSQFDMNDDLGLHI